MYSKAKIGNHPIHPKLVAFPIAFYILTLVGLIVYQSGNPDVFWYKLAYFCNFAAVVMALITAIPGFIDWAFGVPKYSTAKKRGLIHMSLNLSTLALFAVNAYILYGTWDAPLLNVGPSIALTGVGVVLLMGAAYFGWEMISRNKVGVDLSPEQERLQENYERKEPPIFH